jgi:hypothetical protein
MLIQAAPRLSVVKMDPPRAVATDDLVPSVCSEAVLTRH